MNGCSLLPICAEGLQRLWLTADVPVDMLSRLRCELEFGFDNCRAVNGTHNKLR
jgi:hypothetical protein